MLIKATIDGQINKTHAKIRSKSNSLFLIVIPEDIKNTIKEAIPEESNKIKSQSFTRCSRSSKNKPTKPGIPKILDNVSPWISLVNTNKHK